jgi:hypothetical protein
VNQYESLQIHLYLAGSRGLTDIASASQADRVDIVPNKNKRPHALLSRLLASASTQNRHILSKPPNSDKIKYKNLLQQEQTPDN